MLRGTERRRQRETHRSYSWVSQRKVAPGSWKPKCVTVSEHIRGRRRGKRRTGVVVITAWEAVPARSWLRPSDGPLSCHIFTHRHVWPQNCATRCFGYISSVFTVFYGHIFNLVQYLFMVLFLYLVL